MKTVFSVPKMPKMYEVNNYRFTHINIYCHSCLTYLYGKSYLYRKSCETRSTSKE